jgi:hypothetical protein
VLSRLGRGALLPGILAEANTTLPDLIQDRRVAMRSRLSGKRARNARYTLFMQTKLILARSFCGDDMADYLSRLG